MFKDLIDLRKKRRGLEAFGFYLAYLMLGVLLACFAGGLSGTFHKSSTFMEGYRIGAQYGQIVAIVYCPLLCILILRAKRNYTFLSILLVPISGVLAVFLAVLGGLIPVAILTTFRDNSPQVNGRNGMSNN